MNKELFIHIGLFLLLVSAQILIFNNMDIMGITPYIYVLFILLYPVKYNPITLIFISFLLGLAIDVFSNSGGMHASACLVIAYLRPLVLKFAFGTSYQFHHIKFANTDIGQRISYFSILIFIHHSILFLLEAGSFSYIGYSLKHIFLSSIYTIVFGILLHFLFSKKKK